MDENIDLDLEEIELKNTNQSEVQNLMREIEELKKLAIEREQVSDLKSVNLEA